MAANPSDLPPLPKDHLDHPERWATGSDNITPKQAGFIAVLEKQHPEAVPEGGLDTGNLSKSDASDVIDKLKKGEKVGEQANDPENHVETGGTTVAGSSEKEELSKSTKRKEPSDEADKEGASGVRPAGQAEEGDTSNKADVAEKKDLIGEVADKAVKDGAPAQSPAKSSEKSSTAKDDAAPPAKKARNAGAEAKTATKTNGTPDQSVAQGEVAEDPIEVDTETPPADKIETPAEAETDKLPSTTDAEGTNGARGSNGTNGNAAESSTKEGETIPGQEAHLDHPENWSTGDEPATEKQKGYLAVLEKQKGASGITGDVEHLGKSEASAKIDELKHM